MRRREGAGGVVRRLVEEKFAVGSRYSAIGGSCMDNPRNQYYYKKRTEIQGKITMLIMEIL